MPTARHVKPLLLLNLLLLSVIPHRISATPPPPPPPPTTDTHVFIPHGARPAIPSTNRHNDPELHELLTRPFFPVRPADYQGMSYELSFSASYRAYAYHNGVYLGYSDDGTSHETVRGYAGYGDVFSLVARARGGLTGVVAAIAVGPRYRAATGVVSPNGFHVASEAQMRADGRHWKLRAAGSCLWQLDPVVIGDRDAKVLPTTSSTTTNGEKEEDETRRTKASVIRSNTFPFGSTGAKYVWAPGRDRETDGLIWLRYTVGGLPCPSPSPSTKPGGGTMTCYCREIDPGNKGDCYEFDGGDNMSGEGTSRYNDGLRLNQRCRERECLAGYECTSEETTLRCVRRFVEVEIRKATAVFNGRCNEVRIATREMYFPYH